VPITDRYLFEIDGLASALRVVQFTASEAISELFHLELVIASDDPAIAFADVIGKKALLTMHPDDDGAGRPFHGIVSRFRQGEAGKKLTAYHVTVVPKPWKLLHRQDCRIFQEKTALEIVDAVLKNVGFESGTDFRIALRGTYTIREYCVQYRESDWAFVSRLLEEEGVGYFFEHSESGHVLVIADDPASFEPIGPCIFSPDTGGLARRGNIKRFAYSEEIRTGKVTMRDYDFEKPSLLLEVVTEGTQDTDLEVYDHPGDFSTPTEGGRLAKVHLEDRNLLRKVAEGDGETEKLGAGKIFTLAEHSREAFNQDYLVTRVEHQGSEPTMDGGGEQAGVDPSGGGYAYYQNRFECVPATVPFRPPSVTPRPTIKGLQSAVVVGPAGEEIHTDRHGRVKVQFHWDRQGRKNEKSSCWVRVSQVWAGEGWGAMYIPRIGHEVLVDFLDGDPDRPIVIGRVYHGTNVPPYALPDEKTKSTIKSNSTPGGGGSNELRFEDKKDSEEVYLHSQKDLSIVTENDKNQTTGHDETMKVGHDRTAEVVNDHTEVTGHDRVKQIGNDEKETIGNDRTIEVGRDHVETIAGAMTLSVSKALVEDIGENSSETVGQTKTLTAGKDYAIAVTGKLSTTVDSDAMTDIKLEKMLTVGNKITVTCGDATITVEKNGDISIAGTNLNVKTTADLNIESSGKINVKSTGDVKVESSGKVEVKGSGPMDLTSSGAVKVKGTNVAIN
jgi:type VI secretion system secreted protein VgrG